MKEHCRGEKEAVVCELCASWMFSLSCSPEVISKRGLGNVTVDTLAQEITPKARGLWDCLLVEERFMVKWSHTHNHLLYKRNV